ncbi:ABC-2 type transport system permease protein [Fontibacillus phaseoli]|uniref:ABC-2 type transport system permease protein n=1 Tax=Fontibacillus phaseoli TaxID=1416533 RepID=A0A369B1Y2_9BACL|nr:ABC transporter permease [Fontibacillus phaseoli]RCX15335.1 ABC-2 type transport system permease protein [Fontibacillus phaseoli]
MLSFGKLVTNEWLKMFKKRSFFIPYAAIAVVIALVAFMMKQFGSAEGMPTGLEFTSAMFTKNGMGQLLTFLAIIGTAGSVPKEHSLGTIKLLLIRAQSRSKILAAKYVSVLVYILSLSLFAAGFSLLTGGLLFGLHARELGWNDVFLSLLVQLAYSLIYVTVTFMIGVLTRSTGATIGVGMILVLIESLVVGLLSRYDIIKYVLFTNVDLSVYLEGGTPPIQGMTLAFSLIVLAVYMVLFLGTSFVTFKKRDVA